MHPARLRAAAGAALPGLATLRGYPRSWLPGDLLAGVTVAAYLVPQVMAYAGVAGLPPITGLWASLPALLVYALLGSSRSLSMGPESTTAVMTAAAIGPLAAHNEARYLVLTAGLAIMLGLLAIVAGLARLGFVADLLSRPVLTGYLAGLALIMIAGQLSRVTGVPVTGSSFGGQLVSFARHLGEAQPATMLLSAAALALLFTLGTRWRAVPGPLIAVLLSAAAVAAGGLAHHGIAVVGPIPAGLPALAPPRLSLQDAGALVLPALGVLAVAFSDTALTARSFARRTERVNANQELRALGVSNLGAGLLQGFPVSSSASRTAIGLAAGSRSQAYSLVAVVCVLAVLLVGRPVLAVFPTAALGAVVIYAAVLLIDVRAFRRLAAFRRAELLLALATCAGVVAFNLLYGVLIAIGLSVMELLVRVSRPHDAILGRVPGLAGMHNVDDYPSARTIPGLIVYRYDAPLFFANADNFKNRALAAAQEVNGPLRWFVLNVEANVEVDFTGLEAMEALREELTRRGIIFALARVKQELLDDLRAYGLAQKVGEENIYPTLPTAVEGYHRWSREHPP